MLILKVKLKNCVEPKLTNHNNYINNNGEVTQLHGEPRQLSPMPAMHSNGTYCLDFAKWTDYRNSMFCKSPFRKLS